MRFRRLTVLTFSFSLFLATPVFASQVENTVTFHENSTTGDVLSATQSNATGTQLTLEKQLSPSFVNGVNSFFDWNTQPDGSGISYADGATFSFSTSLDLYAIWTHPLLQTATFSSNGGSGSLPSLTNTVGSHASLPNSSGLSNPGYTFVGWNTSPDGSGTAYAPGATYTFVSNQTLYAQWSPNVYQVTFNANGGAAAVSVVNYTYNTSALVLPAAQQTGKSFLGWFNASSGGVLAGVAGANLVPTSSETLYAQWADLANVTLSFNANGGTGSISPISQTVGSSVVLPGMTGMTFATYKLAAWNTSAQGTGTSYQVGQSLTLTQSTQLFAQWIDPQPKTLLGAVGSFAKNSAVLTPALQRQVSALASSIKRLKYQKVFVDGYSTSSGLVSLDVSVSSQRATSVAKYLQSKLAQLGVKHVALLTAGEGSIPGKTAPTYARVELFGA